MDTITNVWNNFCKSIRVGQKNNQKEISFEKSTMTEILSLLGWSRFKENLIEQKRMDVSNTEVIADFVLLDPVSKRDEIIIELKRPNHIQTKGDVSQLWSYMKQSFAPYGLYIGEKIQIYYNKLDRNNPSLINTIEYSENNREGAFLFSLLNADTFNEDKWKNYCEDSLKLMKSVEYWTSDKGKSELFQFILEKAGLSPDFTDRLRSILSISVQKNGSSYKKGNVDFADVVQEHNVEKNTHATESKSSHDYVIDGQHYQTAKDYAFAIVKYLVKTAPQLTYEEIKHVFPKSFSWGPVFLKWNEVILKKQSARSRYFTDQPFRDVNGVSFVISNQWTHEYVHVMREALDKKLGINKKVKVTAQSNDKRRKTSYIIDGERITTAASFGYYFVKRYFKEHPQAKISEIQSYLPLYLWGFKTIVTKEEWEKEYKDLSHKRYYNISVSDSEGNEYMVSNQWDKNSIANMNSVLSKLGWNIETKTD